MKSLLSRPPKNGNAECSLQTYWVNKKKACAMMWRCATEYHQSGSFADSNSRLHKPDLRSYVLLIYEQQVILTWLRLMVTMLSVWRGCYTIFPVWRGCLTWLLHNTVFPVWRGCYAIFPRLTWLLHNLPRLTWLLRNLPPFDVVVTQSSPFDVVVMQSTQTNVSFLSGFLSNVDLMYHPKQNRFLWLLWIFHFPSPPSRWRPS